MLILETEKITQSAESGMLTPFSVQLLKYWNRLQEKDNQIPTFVSFIQDTSLAIHKQAGFISYREGIILVTQWGDQLKEWYPEDIAYPAEIKDRNTLYPAIEQAVLTKCPIRTILCGLATNKSTLFEGLLLPINDGSEGQVSVYLGVQQITSKHTLAPNRLNLMLFPDTEVET